MRFDVWRLYGDYPVQGPRDVSFCDIAVSGSDGGPASAFILLNDTYLCQEERLQRAAELGSHIFIASEFPEELQAQSSHTLIQVVDPLNELMRLAALLRQASTATFIGVTGSSGKTTTKDMIAHVLRGRHKNTLKTFRNYNGLLGIPLTLRKLRDDDRYAVLEIGLGDAGSVDRGAALVRPHTAVVTNVGESHMGRFRDLATIAREKSAILRHLQPGGLAVLNGDDPYCREMCAPQGAKITFFGHGEDCRVRILSARQLTYDNLEIELAIDDERLQFSLNAIGRFQALNAAAAVAAVMHEGVPLHEIEQRFTSFSTGEQRMKAYVRDNLLIVDDGYNASPQGVRVAVAAFGEIPWKGSRVLILGDPQDQGDLSGHYRDDLAAIAAGGGTRHVIWLGDNVAPLTCRVPGSVSAASVDQAAELAQGYTKQGGAILIKGTEDKLLKALRQRLLV